MWYAAKKYRVGSLSVFTAASKVRVGQPNQEAVSSSVSTRTSTAPARSGQRDEVRRREGVQVDDGLERGGLGGLVQLLLRAAASRAAPAAG